MTKARVPWFKCYLLTCKYICGNGWILNSHLSILKPKQRPFKMDESIATLFLQRWAVYHWGRVGSVLWYLVILRFISNQDAGFHYPFLKYYVLNVKFLHREKEINSRDNWLDGKLWVNLTPASTESPLKIVNQPANDSSLCIWKQLEEEWS